MEITPTTGYLMKISEIVGSVSGGLTSGYERLMELSRILTKKEILGLDSSIKLFVESIDYSEEGGYVSIESNCTGYIQIICVGYLEPIYYKFNLGFVCGFPNDVDNTSDEFSDYHLSNLTRLTSKEVATQIKIKLNDDEEIKDVYKDFKEYHQDIENIMKIAEIDLPLSSYGQLIEIKSERDMNNFIKTVFSSNPKEFLSANKLAKEMFD